MSKEEIKDLKQLLPMYLPYGVRVREGNSTFPLSGTYLEDWDNYPTLYSPDIFLLPLSALTETIQLDHYNGGKEFYPLDALKIFTHLDYEYDKEAETINLVTDGLISVNLLNSPVSALQLLMSWHFWIGDQTLFQTGQIKDLRETRTK